MSDENKRLSEEARIKQKRERSNKLDDLVLRSVLGTRTQVFIYLYFLCPNYHFILVKSVCSGIP